MSDLSISLIIDKIDHFNENYIVSLIRVIKLT